MNTNDTNIPASTPSDPVTGSVILDANGKRITEGSVLRSIEDGCQGVVVKIMKAGDWGSPSDQVGDLHIKTSPDCTHVTNRYERWRHVPRAEQSYEERYLSWFHDRDAFSYNGLKYDEQKSDDERKAISGIMALLPEDVVHWETGPWPDSIESALNFLVEHMSSNTNQTGGGL